MLRPTKHTHPKLAVLVASAAMLKELKAKRIVPYDDLLTKLKRQLGPEAEPDFAMYAGFLYLLGRVEYAPKTDSFIYTEQR